MVEIGDSKKGHMSSSMSLRATHLINWCCTRNIRQQEDCGFVNVTLMEEEAQQSRQHSDMPRFEPDDVE